MLANAALGVTRTADDDDWKEFCLGYTRSGTAGSGGGIGSARTIAAAMAEAIRRGMDNIRHFEELGIIEKIGMDRISGHDPQYLEAALHPLHTRRSGASFTSRG